MAGQWKCAPSGSSRLIPAEPASQSVKAVSASFCKMLSGDVTISRAKEINALFSAAWLGGRVGRRVSSAVEMTDSNPTVLMFSEGVWEESIVRPRLLGDRNPRSKRYPTFLRGD